MMQVTKLQPMPHNRYLITLDDGIAFVLYKGDLRHYGIRDGEGLEEESFYKIQEELLPKRARARMLHLLDKRDYTEKQMRDKLREGHYPPQVVDSAVERAKQDHFIDDAFYARRYAECKLQKKSKRQIMMDLQTKGIRRELVEQVFLELEAEGIDSDELQIAKNILEKRHFSPDIADEKERSKQFRYLLSKGIPMDIARQAISGTYDSL